MEPVNISAPSPSEMAAANRRFVAGGSRAAAAGNVAGQTTQLSGLLRLLQNEGSLALDPQLQAQFDALERSVNQATRKPTNQLNDVQRRIANLESRPKLTKKQQNNLAKLQTRATNLRGQIDRQNQRLTDFREQNMADAPQASDMLGDAFPELQQTLADAEPFLDRMGQLGPAGEQLMQALGQGFTAQEIGRGEAGEALYGRAAQMAGSTGQLSPEAARDAVQSARQAFAARGLGTSMGAAAAELLNRDRYSRQRMFEDLDFANTIQQQDERRRFLNEDARRLGTELNASMLGQAFTTDRMVNQEGLGAALQRGQLAGAANPLNMLMGLYQSGERTGSQALPGGATMANTWATNQMNANAFNANANMWSNAANMYRPSGAGGNNMLMGGLGGAASGAATGFMVGGPWGAAIGGGLGLGAGLLANR